MRHKYLCVAAILSSALLGPLAENPASAGRTSLSSGNSPVLVINMRSYRWQLPEFRMAGKNAYAIVQVENDHDYPLRVFVSCRTDDGRIPQMSGYYTVGPHNFLNMDTRRMRDPLQRGEGVMVKCDFRADGHAKIEAWVYDAKVMRTGNGT